MRRKNIILKDKLSIELYLIGYKNIGESVLFIVYNDNIIVYSGVVDSYEQDINKTIDILKRKNIKKLDFICWTHPDEDHSIGIDTLLNNYTSENTNVYIPECINGEEYNYNHRVKSTFEILNEVLKSRKISTFKVKSASDYKILEMFSFDRGALGKEEFKIVSIAPNSTILRKNNFNTTFKKNDYSIGLIMTLGKFTMLLSGDIENRTIENMEYYYIPEVIDYIKTPHHTSDTSDKLLNYINDNSCEIACTTVYRKGKINLPNKSIIELYRSKAKNFYCAGDKSKDLTSEYGAIIMKCDILKKEISINLEGNAYPIYEE